MAGALLDRCADGLGTEDTDEATGSIRTGLRALMAARNIPRLFIESDMMDRRVVTEAQMKNRIDAFFEGLASRRQQEAAAR